MNGSNNRYFEDMEEELVNSEMHMQPSGVKRDLKKDKDARII